MELTKRSNYDSLISKLMSGKLKAKLFLVDQISDEYLDEGDEVFSVANIIVEGIHGVFHFRLNDLDLEFGVVSRQMELIKLDHKNYINLGEHGFISKTDLVYMVLNLEGEYRIDTLYKDGWYGTNKDPDRGDEVFVTNIDPELDIDNQVSDFMIHSHQNMGLSYYINKNYLDEFYVKDAFPTPQSATRDYVIQLKHKIYDADLVISVWNTDHNKSDLKDDSELELIVNHFGLDPNNGYRLKEGTK